MHRDRYIFLINDKARAIACIYDPQNENSTNSTTVFKTLDPTIKKDDLVIVPTGTRVGFTVVKVKDVDVDIDVKDDKSIAWIAGIFDKPGFDALLAHESDAMQKIRNAELAQQRRQLRDEMLGSSAFEGIKTLEIADMSNGAPAIQPAAPDGGAKQS